jgi:NAD(P)-dependent dehydrogenase (short-subunit alcohol dehydrogenase family)
VAARAQEALGGADILVNNAAIYPLGPWYEADAAEWDEVFATNVRGYFLLAKAVRPQMIARGGGSIVNVASVTFYFGEALLVSYVASKGAVIGFTRSLAREAGPEGIRVNAVAPGAFPTAATEIHADQDALWETVLAAQSIKRRGEVEDVALAIGFFAGDDSRFVTGQTLLVDGGWMRG